MDSFRQMLGNNLFLSYSLTFFAGVVFACSFWRRTKPLILAIFYFFALAIYYYVRANFVPIT